MILGQAYELSGQIATFYPAVEKSARGTQVLWQHRGMTEVSKDRADEIRGWLAENGFQVQEGQQEQWFRDKTDVRFIQRGERYRIDLRYGASTNGWRDISKLLASANS